MEVGRTSDENPTFVECVELNHRCNDGERWHYTTTPRNVATMAGSVITRNVVAALAGNALQLATLLRHWLAMCCNLQRCYGVITAMRWTSQCCYDNALDLATLLRQHVEPHSAVEMAGNALNRATLLRCPIAHYNFGQRCATAFLFFFT
jgi:hypothetical protein